MKEEEYQIIHLIHTEKSLDKCHINSQFKKKTLNLGIEVNIF